MRTIKPLPNKLIFLFIIILTVLKIFSFILVKTNLLQVSFGGASDADYYHEYAIGATDSAVNIWPEILRYINKIGLYSRDTIAILLFLLHLFFIPLLVCRLADLKFKSDQKFYIYLYFICLIYPTLFFYTFDVYRDVFMVFSFLVACFLVKKCLDSSSIIVFLSLFLLSCFMGLFLLELRPYLGYAFLMALFLWKIKFTKRRFILLISLYLIVLFIANYAGILDFLTEYRSGFEEAGGGSTLGLNFSNPIMFLPNFILSALGQLLGLYITNPFSAILFLIETIPFFFMLMYVFKNINLADNFVRFLVIFFFIYASVWLIGNDNLGTAVRLRIYNYLAIYICFFYIIKIKRKNGQSIIKEIQPVLSKNLVI